jgi:hypothetical protein
MGLGSESASVASVFPLSELARQGMANQYFASTAPDRNDASLLVTAIELLRGDVPSVLKNFRKMMSGAKSARNTLGSDYLNIQFGWTPLIQEYTNVLRVGLTLDRAVYAETYRRKRNWDGPFHDGHITSNVILNSSGTPWGTAGSSRGSIWGGAGFGVTFTVDGTWRESEDYHWSSRYTGLAKPSLKANSQSDQATDVFKRLGLVDDPRLLWDLTPYSWLADWFTTIGDSITNANAYAPLNGKYSVDFAYLHTQRTLNARAVLCGLAIPTSNVWNVTNGACSYLGTGRWRSRATPFGFGTQLASLNASQYGILVALGLARGR